MLPEYLSQFLAVATIHLFAVMSPGPDFALISRNGFVYSRRVGVLSALGLAMGILVHVTYSLVGVGFIISRSIILFSAVKYAGAIYLAWIGFKSLRAKPASVIEVGDKQQEQISAIAAIRMGFLTNVLNPKVTLFFLALFTQVIKQGTPIPIQIAYGLEMSAMTFLWFAGVASVFSIQAVKIRLHRTQHYFERAFGALIILFSLKVAFARAR